jgi:cardiolipin synthase
MDTINQDLAQDESSKCQSAESPPFTRNTVELLVDGPPAYDAMLTAIAQARHHIHIEMYIYKNVKPGQPGHRFAQALLDMVAEGVEVCLLYDPIGARRTPRSFFKRMKKQGMNVLEYNPINPSITGTGWRPNQRDHRKMLIVDGRIVVTGGIDISRHYAREAYRTVRRHEIEPKHGGWHDIDVRIEGPAVAEYQRTFLETWRRQKGPTLSGDYFPRMEECGSDQVRVLTSHPGTAHNAILDAYVEAIDRARTSAYITMAYFMPDADIENALRRAAKRGVDVALVVPSFSDFNVVIYGQRYHYEGLLKAGVKIFEQQQKMVHAKTAVIDTFWSTVGSCNLDMRSRLHAEEENAVIVGETFARKLEAVFEKDVRNSRPVLLQEWQRRPYFRRAIHWLAHQFRYWL